MKKTIYSLVLFFAVTIASGQGRYGVKIYQNSDFFPTYHNAWPNPSTEVWQANYNRLSFALDIQSKKYFHEIELFVPEISKPINSVQFPIEHYVYSAPNPPVANYSEPGTPTNAFSFRYEVSRNLVNITDRLTFRLGFGLNPYYFRNWVVPTISSSYVRDVMYIGMAVNFIPRLNFKLSERFSLDLNMPFRIFDAQVVTQSIRNPAIPIRQQTTTQPDYIFFRNVYNVRLGIMYSFGGK